MAKQIMQFRYYKQNDEKNQPKNIGIANLVSGSVFTNYYPIVQLGIQAFPGTKFYLNNSTSPILIGSTGIYELDLEGLSEITDLHFDRHSIDTINSINNAYLIIDIVSDL